MRRHSSIVVGLALSSHLLATTLSGLWHRHDDASTLGRGECSCAHDDSAIHADESPLSEAFTQLGDAVGPALHANRHAADDVHECPFCHILAQASTPAATAAFAAGQPSARPAELYSAHFVDASPHTPPHCRAPPPIG